MKDATLAVLGVSAGVLAGVAVADHRVRRRVVQLAKFGGLVTAFAIAPILGERAADWVLWVVFGTRHRDRG